MDESKKTFCETCRRLTKLFSFWRSRIIYSLAPRDIVIATCRTVVQNLRDKIIEAKEKRPAEVFFRFGKCCGKVERLIKGLYRYSLRRVVNRHPVLSCIQT